ncbi:MAG: flavin reductase family protein [Promethearchaeota archaeon]
MIDLSIREALDLIRPLPFTLVTSLDDRGKPNALGVSWVTRTSFDPPLILVSIDHSRYSHAGIQQRGEFVVHYPSEEQARGAMLCGTRSGRDLDKIAAAGFTLVDSKVVGVPTIAGVTAAFECRVVSEHETGDHTIFVGEVVHARGNPEKTRHLFLGARRKLAPIDANWGAGKT